MVEKFTWIILSKKKKKNIFIIFLFCFCLFSENSVKRRVVCCSHRLFPVKVFKSGVSNSLFFHGIRNAIAIGKDGVFLFSDSHDRFSIWFRIKERTRIRWLAKKKKQNSWLGFRSHAKAALWWSRWRCVLAQDFRLKFEKWHSPLHWSRNRYPAGDACTVGGPDTHTHTHTINLTRPSWHHSTLQIIFRHLGLISIFLRKSSIFIISKPNMNPLAKIGIWLLFLSFLLVYK